jgi:hypothetical protein
MQHAAMILIRRLIAGLPHKGLEVMKRQEVDNIGLHRRQYQKEYRGDSLYKEQREIWLNQHPDYYKNWRLHNEDYYRKYYRIRIARDPAYFKRYRNQHRKKLNAYWKEYRRKKRKQGKNRSQKIEGIKVP